MRDAPDPPEDYHFDDEQREQWRRVCTLSWVESSDTLMLPLLIHQARNVRDIARTVADLKARGETLADGDPDEWLAEEMKGLNQILADYFIDPPLARRLGLLPLAVAGDDADDRRTAE